MFSSFTRTATALALFLTLSANLCQAQSQGDPEKSFQLPGSSYLMITNYEKFGVEIIWVDFLGGRRRVKTLPPGQTHKQGSPTGCLWRVEYNGRLLRRFRIANTPQTNIVIGQKETRQRPPQPKPRVKINVHNNTGGVVALTLKDEKGLTRWAHQLNPHVPGLRQVNGLNLPQGWVFHFTGAVNKTVRVTRAETINLVSNRRPQPRPQPRSQAGFVKFYNEGGYVARYEVSYRHNGRYRTYKSSNLSLGGSWRHTIPAGASNIRIRGDYVTAFGNKTIFERSLSKAPNRTYKTYGTIFSPQVN